MAVTYSNYLKISELLKLQNPLSEGPEHDEMLFIIIHQVYELWFKQVIHECHYLNDGLNTSDRPNVLRAFKRILTIFKTMVSQVDIIETMTPLSFNSFRSRLESASGFQSIQFRELEYLLGDRNPAKIKMLPPETQQVLKKYEDSPSLYLNFLRYLDRRGFKIPSEITSSPTNQTLNPSSDVQSVLIEVYKSGSDLSDICERFVDLDEGIQEWRYRHVKMVERTIGVKIGTGGSSGAEYLRSTLFKPLFPDLWAIRSSL